MPVQRPVSFGNAGRAAPVPCRVLMLRKDRPSAEPPWAAWFPFDRPAAFSARLPLIRGPKKEEEAQMTIIDLAAVPLCRRRAASLGASLALGAVASLPRRTLAADFPNKPLRIVVPYAPGGTTDIAARMVGEPLGRVLGQPVVVENKPGANSIVGAGAVATSPPDGHTLAMVIGAHAANATLYAGRLPFDPVASFAPVSLVVTAPLVLAGERQAAGTHIAGVHRAREGAAGHASTTAPAGSARRPTSPWRT